MKRQKPRAVRGTLGLGLMIAAALVAIRTEAAVTHNRFGSESPRPEPAGSEPATAELVATADGRDVYSYIVTCALPESVAIEATIPDAPDTAPPDTLYSCSPWVCTFPASASRPTGRTASSTRRVSAGSPLACSPASMPS